MKRYVLALVAAMVVLAVGAGSAAASGGPGDSESPSNGANVLQGGSSASADGGTNALFIEQGNANEGDVTATGGDADASVDQENEVEDVTQNAEGGVALNAVNPNVAVVLGGGDGGEIHQGGSSASSDGGTNILVVGQQNTNEGDVTATGGDGGGDADAAVDQENEVEDVEQNADGGVAINALNPNIAVVAGGPDGGPSNPCEKSRCNGESSGTEIHQGGSSASADGGTNELFVEQENENEGDVAATGGDGSGSAHSCKPQKSSCNSGGGGGGGDADAAVDQENEVEDVEQNADGGVAINALNPNVAVVLGGGDGGEIHQGGSSASADGGTNELFVEQENENEGDVAATGGDGSGSAHSCKSQKSSCNSGGGGGGGDADADVEQKNEVEHVTQNANGGWAINVLNPNVALVVPHDAGPKPCTKDANRCGGGHESGTEVDQDGSSASADGGTNVLVIEQKNVNKGNVTATGGDSTGACHSCKPQKKCSCNSGGGGGDADADVEQENEVEGVTQNANGGWAFNVLNPNIVFVGPGHRPLPMSKH